MENMENLENIEQVVENVQEVIPVQENKPDASIGKMVAVSALVHLAIEGVKVVYHWAKKRKAEKTLADWKNVFDQAPLEIDEDDDK